MELREAVEGLLGAVLEEFSRHPFIAPYLGASRENPPRHYIHQCEVTGRLALRKPIRALIGDEIGLGKTVTALAITKYLERLGRARKILVIVPRVLVWQWRKELLRIGVPESKVRHLERYTMGFLKLQGFPEGYYIASMDLLKKEERIGDVINVPWDLIIIDEAHKFGRKTRRFWKIGKMLVEGAPRRDVIFLSATPHRGDPQDYIARLQLLDPYLAEGWRALDRRRFYELTHGAILFRRSKEDVNKVYEGKEIFPPARFYAGVIGARQDEAEFVKRLVEFLRTKLVEFAYEKALISEKVIPLLTVLVFKRAASSPYAAWTTLQRLLERRATPDFTTELIDSVRSFLETGYEDYEYPEKDPEEVFNEFLDRTSPLLSERDREEIAELRDMAGSIIKKGDSKLNALVSLLEDVMAEEQSKVIVFTEYKDTLDYAIENLRKRHPEWSTSVLRLSSDETRDEKVFRRIRRAFEEDPRARILLATDVVAEGVNLQVAHILVNYEIPWSLIKLEQRIGRVWRLGQEREVEAYTLFMNNVADFAALGSMYEKLLNLKRAELSPRPVTGQTVLLYAEAEDLARLPPSVAMVREPRKKRFLRVTEERAILTYIREDKAGLERLIASIIAARQEIERDLASKGVLYKPRTREEVERSMELLGFRNPQELLESLKGLVEASSGVLGFKTFEEGGFLKAIRGLEMPMTLATIDDIYGLLTKEGSSRAGRETPIRVVAYGDMEGMLALFPVQVKDRRGGAVLYRELIGVHVDRREVLRGSRLLDMLSQALSSCLGVLEGEERSEEMPLMLLTKLVETLRKPAVGLLEPLARYMNSLESLQLRGQDRAWLRPGDLEVVPLDPLGYIRFVKISRVPPREITEEARREVEEKAVEIVMEIERGEGRVVEIVPSEEHYDVKSVDPSSGDVRFIEVKGHGGPEVFGELTDDEAKLAERERARYWLYIVYNVRAEKPEWVRFRDPLRTMNWEILEVVEKRRKYRLWPVGFPSSA